MTLPVGFPDLHASLLDAVRNEASLPFVLEIESQALKSRKNALDKNLHKRIKAEEHPVIRFKAEGVRAAGQADADGYLELAASGTLFVAGVEKEIEVHARARVEEGALVVEGEKELLMTDFGIKPPVMMLGALKTRNEVRVRFVLKLEQKGGGA
jgi:polyisoprenoid-binding protein YceI